MATLYTPKNLYAGQTAQTPRTLYTPRRLYGDSETTHVTSTVPASSLSMYNDPLAINSILDVISNQAALRKAYGNDNTSSHFKALRDLFLQKTWEPIKHGDFATFAINTLYNVGETLDVFGNITKSIFTPWVNMEADKVDYATAEKILLQHHAGNAKAAYVDTANQTHYRSAVDGKPIEYTNKDLKMYEEIVNSGRTVNPYKLTASERLKSSIGIGNYGRINYTFATGNVITNMLFEILTDPETIVALGAGALKGTVQNMIPEILETGARQADDVALSIAASPESREAIKEVLNAATDQNTIKAIQKRAMQYFTKKQIVVNARESATQWLPGLLGKALKSTGLEETFAVKDLAQALTLALYYDSKSGVTDSMIKKTSALLQRVMTKRVNTMTVNIFQSLTSTRESLDAVQKTLAKASLSVSGIYPVYKLMKHGVAPKVADWITNTLHDSSELYANLKGNRSILSYVDGLENFKRTNRTIIDALDDPKAAMFYNPKYMAQFYPQMADDMVFLNDWFSRVTAKNIKELWPEYIEHMFVCHNGATIAELSDQAWYLIRATATNEAELRAYGTYIYEAAKNVKRLQSLYEVTLKNDIVSAIIQSEPVILKQLEMGADFEKILNILTEPVQTLTKATPTLVADFTTSMKELFTAGDSTTIVARLKKYIADLSVIQSRFIDNIDKQAKFAMSLDNSKAVLVLFKDSKKVSLFQDTLNKAFTTYTKAKSIAEDYRYITKGTSFAPKNTAIIKSSAFKNLFKTTDPTNINSVSVWYNTYMSSILSETDNAAALRFMKAKIWGIDEAVDTIVTFFKTPFNNAEYNKLYSRLTKFLIALKSCTNDPTKLNDIALFLAHVEQVSPYRLNKHLTEYITGEAYYKLKLENYAMLSATVNDKRVLKAMSTIRSGTYDQFMKSLDVIETVPEEEKLLYHKIADTAQQYFAVKQFLAELNIADVSEETRRGVLSSISAFSHLDAQQLRNDTVGIVQKILKRAELNIQQTDYFDESLSLDFIFQKHRTEINAFRETMGLPALAKESHIALDDLITENFVFQNLLKTDPKVKRILDNRFYQVYFDFETQNAVPDVSNQLHQYAILIKRGNNAVKRVNSLNKISELFVPGQDYLNKLYPDMDYVQQVAKYTAEYAGGTAQTEAELFTDLVEHLYKAVQPAYDADTGKYIAAFITHNGEDFDIPLLKAKINQYQLTDVFKEKGIDLAFLDNVESLDTLKLLREQKGYFKVTATDFEKVMPIFKRYSENMSMTYDTRLFNLITTEVATEIKDAVKQLAYTTTLSLPSSFYDQLAQSFDDILSALGDIKDINSALSNFMIPKNLMTSTLENGLSTMSPALKKNWLKFFKQAGLSDKRIERYFGSLDSLNATALLRVLGTENILAYTKAVDPVLMNKWFIGSVLRLNNINNNDAMIITSIGKQLERFSKEVKVPEIYAQYSDTLKFLIDEIYSKMQTSKATSLLDTQTAEINTLFVLKYLRTNNLNIQEQWAVFKFLKNNCPDKIWAKIVPDTTEVHDIMALFNSKGTQGLLADIKYTHVSDYSTLSYMYSSSYQQLLNLQMNFDQFAKFLDAPSARHAPIFDGASQLQIRAMEPVIKLSDDLRGFYNPLAGGSISKRLLAAQMYRKEIEGADFLVKQISRAFTESNVDDTVNWLIEAKAPVMLRPGDLASEEYIQLLNKLSSAEFIDANIGFYAEGKWLYVYLKKNANLKFTLDEDYVTPIYWANNKQYGRFKWKQVDFKDVVEKGYGVAETDEPAYTIIDIADLQKSDDALYFMSDGASGASLYETFSQKELDKVFTRLPQQVIDDMTDIETLKNPLLWKGSQYNHAILAPTAARQEILPFSSGHLVNSLQNATYRRVQEHGTKLIYVQAMLSDYSAVQRTLVGKYMREDPKLAAKWFAKNPEFQAAVLVSSNNSVGFAVKRFDLTTAKGVLAAYEANANIMTMPELNKAWEVINQNIWSETQASTWLSIVRLFKIGYLGTPGTWVRNFYDTLIKNTEVTGENPFTVIKNYGSAVKELRDYDNVIREIKAWTGEGAFPGEEELMTFFQGNATMSYDKFQYLHRFFNDAAAGGEAAVYRKLNAAQQAKYWQDMLDIGAITPDVKHRQDIIRKFNQITNAALNPMNEVERVARLAEYEIFTKQGLTNTKAIQLIEHTHYAYSVKSELEQTMELFIPFYTFASRNLVYWMDVLENNPGYLVVLRDMFAPLWNLDQYDSTELEESNALQNNVLNGNIPIGDSDWFMKTSFSFMDAFQILTDPVDQAKSRLFSPVQTVIDVLLQHTTDSSYKENRKAVALWLQNTFGTKFTKQQLYDKYGEWAAEYEKLYSYKVSTEDPWHDLLKAFENWQYVPLIGTQVSRLENTGLYYDGEGAKQLLYLANLAGKRESWNVEDVINKREKLRYKISALIQDSNQIRLKWQEILKKHGYGPTVNLYAINYNELNALWAELSADYEKLNVRLYQALQSDDDHIWMYSRLRAALGYADVPMKELPYEVREMLLAVLQEQPSQIDVRPVIQNPVEFSFMWKSVKRKYGYADAKFVEIPVEDVDKMCVDVARSAITLTEIRTTLNQDASSRYSYAIAKKNLGYAEFSLYQLPGDALELIKAAMENKVYGTGPQKYSGSKLPKTRTVRPKKVYATKTWTNATPYDTHQGVYANYGHTAVSKAMYYSHNPNIYENQYTRTGKSRMQLAMMPVTPHNVRNQLKDMFSYYR